MTYVPATQPETTSQLLERSLQLFKITFRKVFLMALLLSLCLFLPRLLNLVYNNIPDYYSTLSAYTIFGLALDLLCLILFTAMLWDIRCVMTNNSEMITKDFKTAIKKFPLIIGASLVQGIILILITLIVMLSYNHFVMNHLIEYIHGPRHLLIAQLVLPANRLAVFLIALPLFLYVILTFYIYVLLLFYLPIIVTEGKGIFSSLTRSVKLVWKNTWRVCKLQLCLWAFYFVFLLFIREALGVKVHVFFFATDKISLGGVFTLIVMFSLFISWYTAALLVQLHDLELRKKLIPFDKM
jgi:hypothetical protein